MFYYKNDNEIYQYKLITDPPEAMYWSTYRLKKSHIKLQTPLDRTTTAQIKQEIFNDINETEQN